MRALSITAGKTEFTVTVLNPFDILGIKQRGKVTRLTWR